MSTRTLVLCKPDAVDIALSGYFRPDELWFTLPLTVHGSRWFNCPRCGSTKTDRSRLRWYQAWRTMLSARRPYRCFDCRKRFWKNPLEPAMRVVLDGK